MTTKFSNSTFRCADEIDGTWGILLCHSVVAKYKGMKKSKFFFRESFEVSQVKASKFIKWKLH